MTTSAESDTRETIAEFIADLGITMDAVKHDRRPDGLMPDSSNHWFVTLRRRGTGATMALWFSGGSAVTSISVADVLGCLQSDAVMDDQPFEEWASDMGYDADSREAEAIFRACRRQCDRTESFLGPHYDRLLDCEEG